MEIIMNQNRFILASPFNSVRVLLRTFDQQMEYKLSPCTAFPFSKPFQINQAPQHLTKISDQ